MDHHRQSLRLGAAAILCALVLRLSSGGAVRQLADFLSEPEISSWLIYLETGRIVRFSPSFPDLEVFSMESNTPDFARQEQTLTLLPAFTAADAEVVDIKYNCSLRPDIQTLMTQPLSWDLTEEEPTVLILHTHATESYTKSAGESYQESSAFRTLDERYNMVSIGDRVAQLLEEGGIRVIHDRTLHDYPSYNDAYANARQTIGDTLTENPSVCLVLDLHRDAAEDGNGNQKRSTVTIEGVAAANLMLVMGSDKGSLSYPNWEKNLALAVKLQAQLEQTHPGLCKPIKLVTNRYNQDLSTGALLVEVGTAGNTHAEALAAAEYLAEGILALANGANY